METINTKKIGKILAIIGVTIVISVILYKAFISSIALGILTIGTLLAGTGGILIIYNMDDSK